jgi:hypothetical protein
MTFLYWARYGFALLLVIVVLILALAHLRTSRDNRRA